MCNLLVICTGDTLHIWCDRIHVHNHLHCVVYLKSNFLFIKRIENFEFSCSTNHIKDNHLFILFLCSQLKCHMKMSDVCKLKSVSLVCLEMQFLFSGWRANPHLWCWHVPVLPPEAQQVAFISKQSNIQMACFLPLIIPRMSQPFTPQHQLLFLSWKQNDSIQKSLKTWTRKNNAYLCAKRQTCIHQKKQFCNSLTLHISTSIGYFLLEKTW